MSYLKEEQPWIADLLLERMDHPDMMPYYLSKKHKARLAIHNTLIYGNLEPQVKALQTYNKETITKLSKRLQKE